MVCLNWRRYSDELGDLANDLRVLQHSDPTWVITELHEICRDDPAGLQTRLGADVCLIAFLEFLFFKAEGPFSPPFVPYAEVIRIVFASSDPLRSLLNHNAADAIGNMVLNKRGRLKFAIADYLELMILLDWWVRFGLVPVSQREVFDAVKIKSTIPNRIASRDPGLILRLLEVFPAYQSEFCPADLTKDDLIHQQTDVRPLPSQRRYHQLYEQMIHEGRDLVEVIGEEENRILPMQIKRNTFLGFLVRQLHQETCQICSLLEERYPDPVITVHHITPLSEGGKDIAKNMLVTCRYHHQAIHAGEIPVKMRADTLIEVKCQGTIFHIIPNTGPEYEV